MVSISDKSELGRTKVSIDYDGEDFVIAFQSENFVIFLGKDLEAMRKVCRSLILNVVLDRQPCHKRWLRACV